MKRIASQRERERGTLTDADVAFVLAEDVELGTVSADGGADVGGARDDGIGMMGGGGSGAFAPIARDLFLPILLFVSISSGLIMGACDMTTGCGGGGAGVFIIGLICVDPTFIVGAFAGDCCIVLITADVFNIFAVTNRIGIN